MSVHARLRHLAGRCLYQGYYRPVGAVRSCLREGGPWGRRQTELGRRAMETAAGQLAVPPDYPGTPLLLHLLTGHRFWYQTAFCLHSFSRQAGRTVTPVLHDDGTLNEQDRRQLTRLFPRTRIIGIEETRTHLDKVLPESSYPRLRERWRNYPNIRKLIDVHAGSSGWKLVLDSDLLFFKRPDLLIHWLEKPAAPLHAVDCTESYGYSRALMESLSGHSIAPLVNVGLCGLNSSELDWDRLEHWTATLIDREKTNYYLEQALVAMLVAGRSCTIAQAGDYITFPSQEEALSGAGVMQHYVDTSKRWYFRHCWKIAVPPGP